MKRRDRKSARLKGYDYSGPGDYFVTVCTNGRKCILGDIVDTCFLPSKLGVILRESWEAIPDHFPNVRLGAFQIMPNHVHGVITIRAAITSVGAGHVQPPEDQLGNTIDRRVGTRHAVSLQENSGGKFGKPEHGSLSTIIRSFKSAVTKQVHELELSVERTIWQSRFYDHIIRDDVDHYFIEQYIELNPLYWHLDIENPLALDDENSIEELRNILVNQMHFDSRAIEYLIQNELAYRVWRKESHGLHL